MFQSIIFSCKCSLQCLFFKFKGKSPHCDFRVSICAQFIFCPYFQPEVMVKFTRTAKEHFMMLIELSMLPTECIAGPNSSLVLSLGEIKVSLQSNEKAFGRVIIILRGSLRHFSLTSMFCSSLSCCSLKCLLL